MAELVAPARDGDEAAIRSLLAASQPDIRRLARRTCAVDDVDDAVQQALMILYRRVGALKALASFSSWLFAIVRHECLRLRRRSAPREWGDADGVDALIDRSGDLDLRHDLTRAIQSLPPHYRDVILLRDVEELTVGEIAEALALSRESVKARLHRARRLVREYIMGEVPA